MKVKLIVGWGNGKVRTLIKEFNDEDHYKNYISYMAKKGMKVKDRFNL